jgi:hypothetical protein
MKIFKILGAFLFAGFIMVFGSEIGERFSLSGTERLVLTAEARVGRPLTPVSVAGVARRSVRRCAVGVYNCKLPEHSLGLACLVASPVLLNPKLGPIALQSQYL